MNRLLFSTIGLGGVAVVAVLLSTGPSDVPDATYSTVVQQAQQRLADAVAERERALTSDADLDIIERVVEALSPERLGAKTPTSEAAAATEAVPPAEVPKSAATEGAEARQKAFEQLVSERDDLLLRGSVRAHAAQATVDWELDLLKELSARCGIEGYPLDNEFRFVDSGALREFESRWQARLDQIKVRLARQSSAVLTEAERLATSRLDAIRQALKLGSLAPPPVRRPTDGTTGAWLDARLANRDIELLAREKDLLRAQMAHNPHDIPTFLRLNALAPQGQVGKPSAFANFVNGARRVLARAMLFAMGAQSAPALLPADVPSFVQDLLNDPLRAAQNEARLRVQFDELRAIADPAVRGQVLPDALAHSFEDWSVSHLTDGDLSAARATLLKARNRVDLLKISGTAEIAPRDDLPEAKLQRFSDALGREALYRSTHGRARAPQTYPDIPILRNHIEASRNPATPILARQEVAILKEYGADGGWNSEMTRRYTHLILDESERQLASLEVRTKRLHAARRKLTDADGVFASTVDEDLLRAKELIATHEGRLYATLDDPVLTGEATKVVALKQRLITLRQHAGLRGLTSVPPRVTADLVFDAPTFDGDLRVVQDTVARLEKAAPQPVTLATNASMVREADRKFVLYDVERPRPPAKQWTLDGNPVKYADVDNLKSIKALPGGVAFGRQASAKDDWSGYVLTYDRSRRELLFISGGDVWHLDGIEPETLKACLAYARASDEVAVSIGYMPQDNDLLSKQAQSVFVHQALRDTTVGLDLISADQLPWDLSEATLPNGAKNMVQGQMEPLLKQVKAEFDASLPVQPLLVRLASRGLSVEGSGRQEIMKRLRAPRASEKRTSVDLMFEAVASAPGSAKERLEKFDALSHGIDPVQRVRLRADAVRVFKSLSADPDQALIQMGWLGFNRHDNVPWSHVERMFLALGALNAEKQPQTDRDIAKALLQLMQAKRLSLLTDLDTQLVRDGQQELQLQSALRVRYVRGDIRVDSDGLHLSEKAIVSENASNAATAKLRTLENIYPPIAAARRHAGLIALLRWAAQPGRVSWLDFAELATVNAQNVRTPDYLCPQGVGTCSAP